jgi:rRNA biogenesis protein RRP5
MLSENKNSIFLCPCSIPNKKSYITLQLGWEAEYNPWGVGLSEGNDGTDQNAEAESVNPKKLKTHLSKKEKKELDRLEAEEIARAEQRVLDGEEAEPETAEEFDRLVLASPNSSLCW